MSSVILGETLPSLEVGDKGEVCLVNDDVSFKTWKTIDLKGKFRLIQHLAGKAEAKTINQALLDEIKNAGYSRDRFQTTTIINLKDVVFGTGMIVEAVGVNGKKQFPWTSVVLDREGTFSKAFSLAKGSSAIILVDEDGKVVFFKDGPLSESERSEALSTISQSVAA